MGLVGESFTGWCWVCCARCGARSPQLRLPSDALTPRAAPLQAPSKLHLTVLTPGSEDLAQSVNGQLLAAGLARLVEPRGSAQVGIMRRLTPLLAWQQLCVRMPQPRMHTHVCVLLAPQGPAAEVVEALRACEEQARKHHLGMWEHGDPGSEDDDDGGFPALGGKRGKR